jgi:hypothetical protein
MILPNTRIVKHNRTCYQRLISSTTHQYQMPIDKIAPAGYHKDTNLNTTGDRSMGIFHRNLPNDVLFLMPVRRADEKLPRGKVRMLYCDTAGRVYASIMNRSVYETAQDNAARMESRHKSYATLGLEISPGKFVPTAVEIGPKEVWALEHILEHALKKGRLPDILKQYVKPIITSGKANREAVLSEYKRDRRRMHTKETPRVLDRLPYYSENDIEFSMPIYKAEYSYPLVVLKRLTSNNSNPKSPQRLLILDSDGDLANIRVPYKFTENMEKGLAAQERRNKRNVCAIISQQTNGMAIDYLPISQAQKKALDTITRYFEETGNGKQPISAAVKTVLTRAKGKVSSTVQ